MQFYIPKQIFQIYNDIITLRCMINKRKTGGDIDVENDDDADGSVQNS